MYALITYVRLINSHSNKVQTHACTGGEGSKWSTTSSSSPYTFWKDHRDPEEDYAAHHHKKSVLAKVKDKAKKIRRSLSKKKHSEDGSSTGGSATTPSWGVSLDDDEDDEDAEYAEYLGAPSNIIINSLLFLLNRLSINSHVFSILF